MAKLAPPPFDDARADLQFRTSDDVIFRVYSVVLSLVHGSIFVDMLNHAWNDGQLIRVTDDSHSFFLMLSIFYPDLDVALDEADTINTLLHLAQKYELRAIARRCEKALRDEALQKRDPYGVFAVAYTFRMTDIMQAAAFRSLESRPDMHGPPSRLLQHIPAKAHIGLARYREHCEGAATWALEQRLARRNLESEWGGLFDPDSEYICEACDRLAAAAGCHLGVGHFKANGHQFLEYALEVVKATPSPEAILADRQLGSTAFMRDYEVTCMQCLMGMARTMQAYQRETAIVVKSAIAGIRLQTSFGEIPEA